MLIKMKCLFLLIIIIINCVNSVYISECIYYSKLCNFFRMEYGPSEKIKLRDLRPSDIKNVPYQAAILDGDNLICGATIISEFWLISAAHCFEKQSNKLIIKTGSNSIRKGESHHIEQIVVYDDFDKITLDNDIALIKLTKPIKFNEHQKSIPIASEAPKTDDQLRISGYGEEGITRNLNPTVQLGHVTVMDQKECSIKYEEKFMERFCLNENISRENCRNYSDESGLKNLVLKGVLAYAKNAITDNMFCTDNIDADSCKGDSGGPAIINGKLVGIVSFGDCEIDSHPSIYTKVVNYRDWIKKITGV